MLGDGFPARSRCPPDAYPVGIICIIGTGTDRPARTLRRTEPDDPADPEQRQRFLGA